MSRILIGYKLRNGVDVSDAVLLSNSALSLCNTLKDLGFPQERFVGKQLGRGFADLGYEQFLLLPAGRLLSLFTGHVTPLDSIDSTHLFAIPSVEQMHVFLHSTGCVFESIHCDESYRWHIQIRYEQENYCGSEKSLWETYAHCCHTFLLAHQSEVEKCLN